MNNHSLKLCAAKAIRELLKAEGIEMIYNNIYPSGTRTLKVYQQALKRSDVDLPRLRDRIVDVANAFNFDVKFKFTPGRSWSGAPGFIVKL